MSLILVMFAIYQTGISNLCIIWSFSVSLASNLQGPTKCVSLNNQTCQATSPFVNKKSNQPFHYPFIISVENFVGSCNAIDDECAGVCVPDKVKKCM